MFRSRAVPPRAVVLCRHVLWSAEHSYTLGGSALIFKVAVFRFLGVQVPGCAATLQGGSAEHSYELGGSALFFDVALIRFLGGQVMGCAATL